MILREQAAARMGALQRRRMGVCLAETAGSRPLNAVVELIDGHPALANW
jgi:hypothetical protein